MYRVILNRRPDPQGYDTSLSALRGGLSREELVRRILVSEEFNARSRKDPVVASWFSESSDPWALLKEMDADVTVRLPSRDRVRLRLCGPVGDESIMQPLIRDRGMYEPHVTNLLLAVLRPGDTFIDFGAALGYFTILAGAKVEESGRVVAFEPLSTSNAYCRQNIELNGLNNVTLLDYGLWSERTKKYFLTPPHRFLGGAHIAPEHDPDPYDKNHPKETVQLVAFDELINTGELSLHRLDLVKMDIEGAEPFALNGMRQTIARFRPPIVLELNRHCLRRFFDLDADVIWNQLLQFNYRTLVFQKQIGTRPDLRPTVLYNQELAIIDKGDKLNEICAPMRPIDILAVPNELITAP